MKCDVASSQGLFTLCQELNQQPAIAVDTEFIREKTYFPALALVQVAWEGQDPVLIDPLAIDDWHPWVQVLLNPSVRKVLHAARQDLEIFYYQAGQMPRNVFDTQICAAMCGLGEQVSYANLVSETLGIRLSKAERFTHWLKRPLTEKQQEYARDDVRHLLPLYHALMQRANELGRETWVVQEMDLLLDPQLYEGNSDQMWLRVKRSNTVAPKDRVVLQALAVWRDQVARHMDRPAKFVVPDHALIELCQVQTLTQEVMALQRSLSKTTRTRYGDQLIQCHDNARKSDPSSWPKTPRHTGPRIKGCELVAELAYVLVQQLAHDMAIAPSYLANKKDLQHLVVDALKHKDLSQHPLLQGWRKQAVGQKLLDFLDAKTWLGVEQGNITTKSPHP